MDIRLALMSGIDIPIPECQLILHQPSLIEISSVGEQNFLTGVQCLCINKNMYADKLGDVSAFNVLLTIFADEQHGKEKKEDVRAALTILFPSYKIMFTPRSILFNQADETFIIDEGNFEILQDVIKQVCCLQNTSQDNFNPANAAAKKIADKLMKARARVAAEKNPNGGSMFAQYISTLTVGVSSMSLRDVLNLTIYQLYDLIERYTLYLNWDLDMRARMAGGGSETKPDNWMKNIH